MPASFLSIDPSAFQEGAKSYFEKTQASRREAEGRIKFTNDQKEAVSLRRARDAKLQPDIDHTRATTAGIQSTTARRDALLPGEIKFGELTNEGLELDHEFERLNNPHRVQASGLANTAADFTNRVNEATFGAQVSEKFLANDATGADIQSQRILNTLNERVLPAKVDEAFTGADQAAQTLAQDAAIFPFEVDRQRVANQQGREAVLTSAQNRAQSNRTFALELSRLQLALQKQEIDNDKFFLELARMVREDEAAAEAATREAALRVGYGDNVNTPPINVPATSAPDPALQQTGLSATSPEVITSGLSSTDGLNPAGRTDTAQLTIPATSPLYQTPPEEGASNPIGQRLTGAQRLGDNLLRGLVALSPSTNRKVGVVPAIISRERSWAAGSDIARSLRNPGGDLPIGGSISASVAGFFTDEQGGTQAAVRALVGKASKWYNSPEGHAALDRLPKEAVDELSNDKQLAVEFYQTNKDTPKGGVPLPFRQFDEEIMISGGLTPTPDAAVNATMAKIVGMNQDINTVAEQQGARVDELIKFAKNEFANAPDSATGLANVAGANNLAEGTTQYLRATAGEIAVEKANLDGQLGVWGLSNLLGSGDPTALNDLLKGKLGKEHSFNKTLKRNSEGKYTEVYTVSIEGEDKPRTMNATQVSHYVQSNTSATYLQEFKDEISKLNEQDAAEALKRAGLTAGSVDLGDGTYLIINNTDGNLIQVNPNLEGEDGNTYTDSRVIGNIYGSTAQGVEAFTAETE